MKKYLITYLIAVLFLTSCAPVPPIQSARINSHFSIGHWGVFNARDVKWEIKDSTYHYIDGLPPYGFIPNLFAEPRWCIKKRIEISGLYYPPITSWILGPAWNLNCKTFLYEFGNPQLFRNICSSVFIGSNGHHREWGEGYSIWGGLILGTYSELKKGELELVFQPSGAYTHTHECDDSYGCIDLNLKSVDFGLGAIYIPGEYKVFELVTGVTFKYHYYKKFSPPNSNIRLLKLNESPFFFHLGLVFNVIR